MNLIGTSVAGGVFEVDPKAEWIKINNVVLGESPKYGYTNYQSKDIGALLDTVVKDSRVVVLIYEWRPLVNC